MLPSNCNIRICITIAPAQADGLKKLSELTQEPQSEIIRRAIDATLEKAQHDGVPTADALRFERKIAAELSALVAEYSLPVENPEAARSKAHPVECRAPAPPVRVLIAQTAPLIDGKAGE